MQISKPIQLYAAALTALGLLASAHPLPAATFHWKSALTTGNWSNPNAWSATSPAGADNAGVPTANATANLLFTDGLPHTIQYDYTGPAVTLDLLQINLTGNPTNTTTLNMTANALTASTTYIGYSGAGGSNGAGTFTQSGGAFTLTGAGNGLFLGLNPTDKGQFTLAGGSAVFNNVQVIGYAGAGTFNQFAGTYTINNGFNGLTLGQLPGSFGVFNLAGGTLTASNPINVGLNGNGTFNHTAGALTLANSQPLLLAAGAGSTGTYILSGSAALATGSGDEFVGYSANGNFLQSGGTNTTLNLRLGFNPSSRGTYTLSAGTLATFTTSIGASATTNAPTGALLISGGTFTAGTINLYQNSTFQFSAGVVSANTLTLNSPSPNFIWTGGTLTLSGSPFQSFGFPATTLSLPFAAAFTGADISANAWLLNNTFTLAAPGAISVGTVVFPRHLAIAANAPAALTLNHPAAAVSVSGNLFAGGTQSGPSGFNALLSISAGNLTVAGLLRSYLRGTITLSGGTLNAALLATDPNSPIQWTGGTLNLSQSVMSPRYFTSGSDLIYTLNGIQSGTFTGSDAAGVAFAIQGDLSNEVFNQNGTGAITVGSPQFPRHLAIGTEIPSLLSFSGYTLNNPATSLTVFGNIYLGGTTTAPRSLGLFQLSNGAASANTLKIWDFSSLTLAGGTLSLFTLDASANPAGINWTAGTLRLKGGAILGPTALTIPTAGTLAGSGGFLGNVTLNGNITLSDPFDTLLLSGAVAGPGNASVAPSALLSVNSLRINALSLAGTARLLPAASNPTASTLNALSIAGTTNNWSAQFELTNNPLILQASANKSATLSTLQNQLLFGTTHPAGITSSTTAADPTHKTTVAVDNALLHLTTFFTLPVDDNSLLILSTYLGDSNLDRKVNVTDLGTLATHYGQPTAKGILDGDFNQDGLVNVSDLGLLATNYGQGTNGQPFSLESDLSSFSVLSSAFPTPIPEPASLTLLLPLAFHRRRRR